MRDKNGNPMCALWKAPDCNWLVAAFTKEQAAWVNNKESSVAARPEDFSRVTGAFVTGNPRIIDLNKYDGDKGAA